MSTSRFKCTKVLFTIWKPNKYQQTHFPGSSTLKQDITTWRQSQTWGRKGWQTSNWVEVSQQYQGATGKIIKNLWEWWCTIISRWVRNGSSKTQRKIKNLKKNINEKGAGWKEKNDISSWVRETIKKNWWWNLSRKKRWEKNRQERRRRCYSKSDFRTGVENIQRSAWLT